MTKAALSRSIRRLPVTDRIELIDEIWHSVAADQAAIPIPGWQKEMIDESLAEIEAHPGRGIPLETFRSKVRRAIDRIETQARKKRS